MNRHAKPAAALIALITLAILSPVAALAAFGNSVSVGDSRITSATLQPPTNLAVQFSCVSPSEPEAHLDWTATPSAFADGYQLERWRNQEQEEQATITPKETTAAVHGPLTADTEYQWRIWSIAENWTSNVATLTATSPPCSS